MLVSILVVFGAIYLFSNQMIKIAEEYQEFTGKLEQILTKSIDFLNQEVQLIPDIQFQEVITQLKDYFSESGLFIVSDTITVTSTFLSYLLLIVIYTFLILLYGRPLAKGLTQQVKSEDQKSFYGMLKEMQQVGQKYLTGVIILILVIGSLGSIGLLLMGVKYAFFFGFMAGFFAVIPFIGVTVGGIIAAFYTFLSYDSYLLLLGVVLLFWFLTIIEGNVLNPRIVGGNLNLNALAAIIALITGGFLWGIAGMIIFLPMTAILRVVCEHVVPLKPLAVLLGANNQQSRTTLWKKLKRLFSK
jgi:predicted PurR-regulated permease PerM